MFVITEETYNLTEVSETEEIVSKRPEAGEDRKERKKYQHSAP